MGYFQEQVEGELLLVDTGKFGVPKSFSQRVVFADYVWS